MAYRPPHCYTALRSFRTRGGFELGELRCRVHHVAEEENSACLDVADQDEKRAIDSRTASLHEGSDHLHPHERLLRDAADVGAARCWKPALELPVSRLVLPAQPQRLEIAPEPDEHSQCQSEGDSDQHRKMPPLKWQPLQDVHLIGRKVQLQQEV